MIKKIEFENRIEYQNEKGECHREDGPAIEWKDGDKYWYQNGEYHRIGGPAVEFTDGLRSFCLNGKSFYLNEYCSEVINQNLMTEEEVALMILKYS